MIYNKRNDMIIHEGPIDAITKPRFYNKYASLNT